MRRAKAVSSPERAVSSRAASMALQVSGDPPVARPRSFDRGFPGHRSGSGRDVFKGKERIRMRRVLTVLAAACAVAAVVAAPASAAEPAKRVGKFTMTTKI